MGLENFEQNLVTSCVLAAEVFPSGISPELFEKSAHRELWGMLTRLKSEGRAWDAVTLYAQGSEGVKSIISDMGIDDFIRKDLVPEYVNLLREKYRKRIASRAMADLETKDGDVDPVALQAKIAQKLAETDQDAESQNVSLKTGLLNAARSLENLKEGRGLLGITTGIKSLDNYFKGFQKKKLYVLAARPSMGKSALMLNFVLGAARAGHNVFVHCLEETIHSVSLRALANETGLDNEALQSGKFRDEAWSEIYSGIDCLSKLPIYLNEQSNVSPDQICNNIRSIHLKKPLEMVYIDHIQEIKKSGDNWHQSVNEAAGKFKALAKDLSIPVLIVSQLNRGVESRVDKKPMLSDLRESGGIEEKADIAMLLYRGAYYYPDQNPNHAELFIAKNRDGRTGTFNLYWQPDKMRYRERADFEF